MPPTGVGIEISVKLEDGAMKLTVVMHSRQYRDGFLGHVHTTEDRGCLRNTRESLMQNFGR